MGKVHLFILPEGLRQSTLAILDLTDVADPEAEDLQRRRAMFNLNRDLSGNHEEHFDPTVHLADPFPCRTCERADLPSHQALRGVETTFRDAWEDAGTAIRVNMAKARLIHMDRIRVVRNDALVKESGSKYRQPTEIEALLSPGRRAQLQALRDIPQTFDLTKYRTPATLKAAWPPELPP